MEWYGFFIFLGIFIVYCINFLYFKMRNIEIDIDSLLLVLYLSSFFGGKLIYLLFDSSFIFSFNDFIYLFFGGFSLLGASFFALSCLLFFINKKKLHNRLNSLFPISLLLLHCFGRIGCYLANCCGGSIFGYTLHLVSVFFYFVFAFIGILLFYFSILKNFFYGLIYYILIVFFERFIFDRYRYDCIIINDYFTKYQFFALCYLIISIFLIIIFYRKSNILK